MGGSLLACDRTFALVSLPLPLACSACSPDNDRTGRENVHGTMQWWLSGLGRHPSSATASYYPMGDERCVWLQRSWASQGFRSASLCSLPLAISLLLGPRPRPSPRSLSSWFRFARRGSTGPHCYLSRAAGRARMLSGD